MLCTRMLPPVKMDVGLFAAQINTLLGHVIVSVKGGMPLGDTMHEKNTVMYIQDIGRGDHTAIFGWG